MTWLNFLVQVNIYLSVFYLFYTVLLQNETYYTFNRIYLVGTACISFLIPPFQFQWVKELFVTEEVQAIAHVYFGEEVLISTQANQNQTSTDWIWAIYLAGTAFFLAKFLYSVFKLINFKTGEQQAYSFFNRIVISEDLENRETILSHEKVHAKQWHSADIILFEFLSIINWFNPIAHLYKKAIRFIHEFIADEEASSKCKKSDYALLLLSNTMGLKSNQLTNSFFNESLLKRRILMLNKSKSSKTAMLKYGLSAPLFLGMTILSSANLQAESLQKISRDVMPRMLHKALPDPKKEMLETQSTTFKSIKSQKTQAEETNKEQIFEATPEIIDNKQVAIQDSVFEYGKVDVMPEFPGGIHKFYDIIGKTYSYPKAAKEAGVQGRIVLNFVVEKDGTLSNIKVLRDLGYGTGDEAKRILQQSLKWNPGIQKGKPVKVSYTLPIMLNLENQVPLRSIPEKAFILLNGKHITREEFIKIDQKTIESMNVIKDKTKYSEYGAPQDAEGVILIKLK